MVFGIGRWAAIDGRKLAPELVEVATLPGVANQLLDEDVVGLALVHGVTRGAGSGVDTLG